MDIIGPTPERARRIGERLERPGVTRNGMQTRKLDSHRIADLFERMNLSAEEKEAIAKFEKTYTNMHRVVGLCSSYGQSPRDSGFGPRDMPQWIINAHTSYRDVCSYINSPRMMQALELPISTDISWPALGQALSAQPTMHRDKATGYAMGIVKEAIERLTRFYDRPG